MFYSEDNLLALKSDSLRNAMRRYIHQGIRPGHFVSGIITNNALEAITRADRIHSEMLPDIMRWMFTYAPTDCWGSKDHLETWCNLGGLDGIKAEAEREKAARPMKRFRVKIVRMAKLYQYHAIELDAQDETQARNAALDIANDDSFDGGDYEETTDHYSDWSLALGAGSTKDITPPEGLDTTSSASRQHFIDTGLYLKVGEVKGDADADA